MYEIIAFGQTSNKQWCLGVALLILRLNLYVLTILLKMKYGNFTCNIHKQPVKNLMTDAIDYAFEITQGQPWLVNALAYEACFRDCTDRSVTITKDIIERAKETLIKRRDTHLDVLIDKLQEPRVRNIIDAIITGIIKTADELKQDDIQYVRDLGLIKMKGFGNCQPNLSRGYST